MVSRTGLHESTLQYTCLVLRYRVLLQCSPWDTYVTPYMHACVSRFRRMAFRLNIQQEILSEEYTVSAQSRSRGRRVLAHPRSRGLGNVVRPSALRKQRRVI